MDYNYNKKSIWKWILLYILIAVVAYGLVYYFFFNKKENNNYNPQDQVQNNTSETADWKTYENNEYGFEIKYPNDWNYGPNIYRDHNFPVFCPPQLIDLTDKELGCQWHNSSGPSPKPTTDSPILMFVETSDYILAADNNGF